MVTEVSGELAASICYPENSIFFATMWTSGSQYTGTLCPEHHEHATGNADKRGRKLVQITGARRYWRGINCIAYLFVFLGIAIVCLLYTV